MFPLIILIILIDVDSEKCFPRRHSPGNLLLFMARTWSRNIEHFNINQSEEVLRNFPFQTVGRWVFVIIVGEISGL